MDYRCLYGHRVPADFSFAIDNDACPRCGAQLVSLSGYQLARTLATGVPLEAVQAFATVRFLESNFTLTPKGDEAEEPSDEEEESVGEIEIDESDEASEDAPVLEDEVEPAPVARAELGAEPEETEEVPADANTPVEEPIMPAPEVAPTGPVAPIVLAEIPKKDDESLDDVEKAFFQ
jgi:hypothetical protein